MPKLERDIDVEDEAISLDRIVRMLEPAKRLRLVILDACRDNPFARTMRRTMASRVDRARPRQGRAADLRHADRVRGEGRIDRGRRRRPHSPFTAALLKHLTTPGLDLRLAFGRVRDDVMQDTGNRQEPFVYGSLGGANVALVPKHARARTGTRRAPVGYAGDGRTRTGRQRGVARLRTRRAGQHQGNLGRVPRDPPDRLLCRPRPRPARQADHDGAGNGRPPRLCSLWPRGGARVGDAECHAAGGAERPDEEAEECKKKEKRRDKRPSTRVARR